MTSEQTANLLYSLLFLVLVVSSLAARRLPLGQTLRYALVWVAIFAGALVLYSFRSVFVQGWELVRHELVPGEPVQVGNTIRIRMDEDGHFHVDSTVNGHAMRFLIDSGATTTMVSETAARAAGLEIDESGFPVAIETANGAVAVKRARIASLRVGSIERREFPILIGTPASDNVNLLGMNFLSSLRHWRVEGREMVLEP